MTRTRPDVIDHQDPAGSSLQGRLYAGYDQMVRVFGQPGGPLDEDKSHVEWTVQTPHGAAMIYDYGDCHECEPGCHRDPRPGPQQSADVHFEWHVGGHNPETAEWVRCRFAERTAY